MSTNRNVLSISVISNIKIVSTVLQYLAVKLLVNTIPLSGYYHDDTNHMESSTLVNSTHYHYDWEVKENNCTHGTRGLEGEEKTARLFFSFFAIGMTYIGVCSFKTPPCQW